ncbi:BcPKS16, polyketide synthase [Camillea tinctor]|nr:BcPKS16, polyketide synthase [Camillea tinctor]
MMTMPKCSTAAQVSAAFFCPQTKRVDEIYLKSLHRFLSGNQYGRTLLGDIADLANNHLWELFASANSGVRRLSHGPKVLAILRGWAVEGTSAPLSGVHSNITSLPLLAVLQIAQYLRYLEIREVSHKEFVNEIREGGGGVHGYCGGLPAAVCIGSGKTEEDVVKYMGTALKILVGIGAYTEAADEDSGSENTLLAIRLKHEGQGEELTRQFPGTYISAITGPKSVSIGGPAKTLRDFRHHMTEHEGIRAQEIHLGGSAHNPENSHLAAELCRLCQDSQQGLQLPEASQLLLPLRTNQTGQLLTRGSLTDDLIWTMLAARCEWLELLKGVAQDLTQSSRAQHHFAIFGWDDCVTMSPFHQQQLRVTKVLTKNLILEEPSLPDARGDMKESGEGSSPFKFPENSIAVVGVACRLPGAKNMDELWDIVAKGRNCVQELPGDRFNMAENVRASTSGSFVQSRAFYGNFIDDVKRFDHAFFGISAREAANMDPQQRIMLELSFEALEDAGYLVSHERKTGDNVGCFIGLVLGEYVENTNSHPPTAYTSTGTVPAFLCGRLSHYYGWSGPSEMFNTACSSSMVAINRACKAIQIGECRMAVAGGANVMTGVNTYIDLAKAGFLSPTGQCRPFDASADGYCRADGCGLVVLKKLGQAIADGDAIWGVIPGVATNQGGLSASLTVPDTIAQQALYRKVLTQAGIREDQVTYVEAHGTGTQVGDPIEMDSIRSVFGSTSRQKKVYVGSIKGNIGHAEPSAGIAGLLKVLVMLRQRQIPPQASYRDLNPKIGSLKRDGLEISNILRPWDAPFRAALVNSYGAAGSNGALLCCSLNQNDAVITGKGKSSREKQALVTFPLFITSASENSLINTAKSLGKYLQREAANSNIQIADVAFTLNKRRRRQKYLTHVKADSIKEAGRLLSLTDQSNVSQLPANSHIPKPIVFAFSGQTSRHIALPTSFYDSFPRFRFFLDTCNFEFQKLTDASLFPAIFQADIIEDTATLHCGIFAVQYSCARCWMDAGAQPNAVVGHSLGELTALAVSGVLSLAETIRLIATRGRLIEKSWGPDKGSMLAVECTVKDFEELSSMVPQLEIACFNGPKSVVVAGPNESIVAAEEVLRTQRWFQNMRFERLKISHAFHSALTDPILTELEVLGSSLRWNEPRIPLYACSSNGTETRGQDAARHARQPVFFVHAINRIEDALGSCLWLEAGLDTPIIAMAKRSCNLSGAHIFQSLKTKGTRHPESAIADVVASLWSTGCFVDHWSFLRESVDTPYPCHPVWLPSYQFAETRPWLDNIDRAWEIQANLQAQSRNPLSPKIGMGSVPVPLVTKRYSPSTRAGCAEFLINTETSRYRAVVGGHMACSRPLCPASMDMECATAALHLLLENDKALGNKSLVFEKFDIRSPLGLEMQGEVVLRLEELSGVLQAWKITIASISSTSGTFKDKPIPGETIHMEGVMSLVAGSILESFQRLVSRQIQNLADCHTNERWYTNRIYKLFSRVVMYDEFFKGMRTVQINQNEAVAAIKIPHNQPYRDENEFWKVCDSVVLDTCIHVVGLLVNTNDAIPDDEVAVMTGLDRAVLSPSFSMDSSRDWTIYATCEFTDDKHQAFGDVYVCSPEGGLVAMFSRCRLSRLPIAKLEKALDAAYSTRRISNSRMTPYYPHVVSPVAHGTVDIQDNNLTTTQRQLVKEIPRDSEDTKSALKELLAECTMIDKSQILEDISLGLLLSSAKLSEELNSRFGLVVNTTTLLESTYTDIQELLNVGLSASSLSELGTGIKPSAIPQTMSEHQEGGDSRHKMLFHILADISGARPDNIQPSTTLADLGIDSLSLIDLKQEIEDHFSMTMDLDTDSTVQQVMNFLGVGHTIILDPKDTLVDSEQLPTLPGHPPSDIVGENPFDILRELGPKFDESAKKHGVLGYLSNVAPLQDELTVAYIVEALAALGVNLDKLRLGVPVPQFPYTSPKYDKLVRKFWEILQKYDIVTISQSLDPNNSAIVTRGSSAINHTPTSELLKTFNARFPMYLHDTNLMDLTGPRLADCLQGRTDPVSLMFGNAHSLQIMENYYGYSPLTATLTEKVIIFLTHLFRSRGISTVKTPVQILEVGGGTGGTTRWLAEALDRASIETQYTFTDISSSLVKKAKSKFQNRFPWISYSTLNLEVEIEPSFAGQFDVVIATNVVHATKDRTATCRRILETLAPSGGLFVLAETTTKVSWCDICFGLLDGWWFADGPIAPLQTAPEWMKTFEKAGFTSVGCSNGSTPDVNIAQLIVGSNICWKPNFTAATIPKLPREPTTYDMSDSDTGNEKGDNYRLDTVVYKEAGDVKIHADIYYPKMPSTSSMPVALMIHGGGYVTLSRRAVRPEQTRHLIRNGLLPVSIDYRLCPEVNINDGPMTDVCDAYRWAQEVLPEIALEFGVQVDPRRVAVVGWSTGGQLAMSLGWTAEASGLPPPAAVLSFYAPVDFESGELDNSNFMATLPEPELTLERIIEALPSKPVTNSFPSSSTSDMGWVKQGDPRSELLITMSRQGIALPVLLNGLSCDDISPQHRTFHLDPPSHERVASISPFARLRAGQYSVPTFIAHGTIDDVAPFAAAQRFMDEIACNHDGKFPYGFLSLYGARHLFDLELKEGSQEWNEMVAPGYHFLFEILNIA